MLPNDPIMSDTMRASIDGPGRTASASLLSDNEALNLSGTMMPIHILVKICAFGSNEMNPLQEDARNTTFALDNLTHSYGLYPAPSEASLPR